jgi:serine/threonine-protein kinase
VGQVTLDATVVQMSDAELAKTLRLEPGTLADFARTIAQSPSSTIEPVGLRSDVPGRRALELLGAERGEREIVAGLSLERTIGEGGMGIVRLATQRSLGRKVAVKTLRAETKSEQATLRLLREAWVTGSLEHPNIVPVYDLGLDEDGSPIIVLKKIEGVTWESLLRDAAQVKERFGAADLLEYNLRILVQLCNAVSLAHARGILHRDLKPENVMIGSFGEVYLVDWGIAVSLRDDPTGRLPLASEAKEIAGTPCYMAPEMLGALGGLSEATDVYLLGAVLHEVLTGAPPHQGSFREIVASILLSNPSYGPDVPIELAAIAKKAMSREAIERFSTADELRKRLEWYLRHRGSLALSTIASHKLAEMRALVAAGNADRERVHPLAAEARFGFRQALEASPENDAARSGLRDATEAVVDFELALGKPDAAAAALAELADPPAALARRVARALEDERRERERLRKLEAGFDLRTGRRTRLATGIILGTIWALGPQIGPYVERRIEGGGASPMRLMFIWTSGLVIVLAIMARWGRESLNKTVVNRSMGVACLLVFSGQFFLELVCQLRGVPFVTAMILHYVVWFLVTAVTATFLDRRLLPSAFAYLAGVILTCLWPDRLWDLMSLSHGFLLVNAIAAWSTREDKLGKLVGSGLDRVSGAKRG